ncbi:MAG: site-specific integrase [Bacillota bacterium]
MDADGTAGAGAALALARAVRSGGAGIAVASRRVPGARVKGVPALRRAATVEVPAVRRVGGGSAPGRSGGSLEPDWITKRFGKEARELGLPPVRFHGLRHTHATLLLKANVQPKVVSERMGDAQVGVTLDGYSHILPGMQEEAALAIDQILRAASPPAV